MLLWRISRKSENMNTYMFFLNQLESYLLSYLSKVSTRSTLSLGKSLLLFVIALVISGILYACGGSPGNARCMPIIYPSGEKNGLDSYEVARSRVAASFDEVMDFFDESIEPIPRYQDWESGVWQVKAIDENRVLFSCFAVSESGIDAEWGCILVKEDKEQTFIETTWYLSGDGGPICEHALSINP